MNNFRNIFIIAVFSGVIFCSAAMVPGGDESGYVNFSFHQVDISTFVKLVGDITGRKFVVSDNVSGKVTIVSPRVSRKEVYPLFVSILESCGCSVMQEGGIYKVVALPERKAPIGDVVGVGEPIPSEGVVTKIMHLEHVSAGDIRKTLEGSVSGGKEGAIGAIEETNHLLVTDTAENIKRIEKIIAEVDKPGLSRTIEVVFLQYANAVDLADQLNLAMYEGMTRAERLRNRLPSTRTTRISTLVQRSAVASRSGMKQGTVVASPHSNSLMLVGTPSQNEEIKRIIGKMDVDSPSGRGHLNAIFLKYIAAEEAAKNITNLLEQLDKKKRYDEKRDMAVAASIENNALIVDAMPGDFDMIKKLVKQLDRVPEQVHITVLIAETSAGEGLNLGIEMAAVDLPDDQGSTVVQGSIRLNDSVNSIMNTIQDGIFPAGISAGVAYGNRVDAEGNVVVSYPGAVNINALKRNSSFKVLSETSLEAQNNKEASVNVVEEIPILKSTIEGAGDARDIIQNIERIEVGIKLKLTPHVIPGGEVQMELNPSIEAVLDPGSSGNRYTPTIARRQVATTVTVPDGRTIVIAGLTREDSTKTVKKVPILGSIPLIGLLFRDTVSEETKRNLMIFVTPRIVSNLADTKEILDDWQKKTGIKGNE